MEYALATVLHDAAVRQIEDRQQDNEEHRVRSDASTTPMIYASELGKCPLYLYNKLAGLLSPNSSYSSTAFLEDGLLHEQGLRDLLTKAGVTLLPPSTTAIRYKVTGTDIMISGRPDILVTQDGALMGVIEVKAVKDATFQTYKDNPSLIPPWYWHQLAYYMVVLQASQGLLLIKNRDTSEWLPDFLPTSGIHHAVRDLGWAQAIIGRDSLLLKDLAEGRRPNTLTCMQKATEFNECRYCAARRSCYITDSTEDTVEKVAPLDLSSIEDEAQPVPALAALSTNLKEVIRLTKEVNSLGALLDVKRDSIQTSLQELGKTKVIVDTGSAVMVAGSSRSYPDSAVVKQLVASGAIPVKTSVQAPRLMVNPKKGE